jgi:hypothetical protein
MMAPVHLGSPLPLPANGPSGASPYPGTGASISYPSATGFSQPGTSSQPRFQYPNGVMSAPKDDRRKTLFAILGAALILAIAGIGWAVTRSGDAPAAPDESAATTPAPAATTPAPAATPATTTPAATTPAPAAAPAPTLASLSTGTRSLPAAAFGTDEAALIAATRAPAPAVAPPDPIVEPAPEPEPEPKRPELKWIPPKRDPEPPKRDPDPPKRDPDPPKRDPEPPKRDPEPAVATNFDAEGAREDAADLYAEMKFGEASALLRKAAKQASKKDAGRLAAAASGYDRVASALAQAKDADPAVSLKAYRAALRADEQSGDSEHQDFIKGKLASVAPRAAGAAMAAKRYGDAKLACDAAESAGAGAAVQRVRESLERKAAELATQAQALARDGKGGEATAIAREVLTMVPKSSPSYAKAAPIAKGG